MYCKNFGVDGMGSKSHFLVTCESLLTFRGSEGSRGNSGSQWYVRTHALRLSLALAVHQDSQAVAGGLEDTLAEGGRSLQA